MRKINERKINYNDEMTDEQFAEIINSLNKTYRVLIILGILLFVLVFIGILF
jgi:hypothetical protein